MDAVERLSLEALATNSLEALEHVHRYQLSADLCSGLRVLDLCCGSGYGSRILREVCPVVTGVDYDLASITAAQSTFGQHQIEFEAADALEVLERPLEEQFDAIVMLEGLEHLPDPERALERLQAHASAELKLVVSIPNSKMFGEENPFHRSDFSYDDAVQICSRFERASLMYQFLAEGSLIRTMSVSNLVTTIVEPERGELDYANHFLLCVNADAEIAGLDARMQLAVSPVQTRHMRNLELANESLRRENARLGRSWLGKAETAASNFLAKLERERAELAQARLSLESEDVMLDPVAAERQKLIRRVEELHEQVLAQDRQLREMTSTRVWRIGARYWSVRDRLKRLRSRAR